MTPPDDLARLRASQRVIQRVVQGAPDLAAIEALAASGFVDGLPRRDVAALAAQDPRRLYVYRKLIRGTMVDSIAAQIPRAAARLGDRYRDLVHRFCDEELPRSRVLRDVAFEFARWATPHRLGAQDVPPFLADLMRFELFEFDVYAAVARLDEVEATSDLGADQRVAFCGTARLARFAHAVHRLPDDPDDRSVPTAGEVGVLAYRDADGVYRQLELTPVATAIFGRMWLDGAPLAAAVEGGCRAAGVDLTAEVIAGTSQVLEDLSRRGVALGGRDSAPPPPSPFSRWLFGASPDSPPTPT